MRVGIESVSADKFAEAFGEIEEITGQFGHFSDLNPFIRFKLFGHPILHPVYVASHVSKVASNTWTTTL